VRKLAIAWVACAAVALGASQLGAAGGGTISGTVKYGAPAPKPVPVEVTSDKDVCGPKPHFEEDLVVGKDGGIANAVVIVKGAKGETRPAEVTFDQKGCDYSPHVLAFPAGSTVDIVNSDGILHNVHTYATANPSFNLAQPEFRKVIKKKIDKPDVIRVTCDVHRWMRGWWYVTDNPYYAVTGDKGDFTINDVPPGSYTIEVWQEKLGTQDQKVDVKPGARTTVDFTLRPKD